MAEKIFYTMGEVAEMFDVNTSLIRHWESQFAILRPKRNKKGNRLFSPRDVENLKMIYHLVKECGMTLEGAKKALRNGSAAGSVERDTELMERLQRIRSLLAEAREDLKAGDGELLDEESDLRPEPAAERTAGVPADPEAPKTPASAEPEKPVAEKPARRRSRAVVKIADGADLSGTEPAVAPEAEEPKLPGQPTRQIGRKPRRKKEEVENKELFAFYEQSLF